ncbi:TetR/AcrR family transcriptional regulator [Hamadaea tsunoensis]|uniref:TetR/AcrR family transcriptional regulator n=1 Tax=Hamadaea tsunoensis TaxID=53368 RepID=UPI000428AC38|nr:TetR/AcrR family transcriptional regulator [Hamadaea tsunoensis]
MPRDTLSRDQILRAAVELLDAEGLEGLNMRALGQRLGSAATAVYWHVGSKDNLVALAGDLAWNEIDLPEVTPGTWRPAATALATGLYGMLCRHPWVLQAFGTFLLVGPGKARYDDRSLAVYEEAGFPGTQADQAAAAVFTFVLGNALGASAAAAVRRRLAREGESAEAQLKEAMAKAVEYASAYPRLRPRLDTASSGYAASPEQTFELGLAAVLDGLAGRLGADQPSNGSRTPL